MDTSRNIIKESFKSLSLDLVDTHVANLQDGTLHSSPSSFNCKVNIDFVLEDASVGQQVWGKIRDKESIHLTKLETSAVTPKIHNLMDHFDKQLESAMEDLKFLIYESTVGEPEEENLGGGANHKRKHDNDVIVFTWYLDEDEEESEENTQQTTNPTATTPTEADTKLARMRKQENRRQRLLLREYLQQTCFEAVSALLQVLKAKMDHLGVCVVLLFSCVLTCHLNFRPRNLLRRKMAR